MTIEGHATAEGTRRYQLKLANKVHPAHFRKKGDLLYSSIGLGTYLGHHDETTDRMYEQAILQALELGCNVFDSAINYRCMRSERLVGRALARAFDNGYRRDEMIVSTKGGFIPFEGQPPADPETYIREQYIDKGLCTAEEIVAGCHCISPGYLRDQLQKSLHNLALSTVDVYYVHNPETQLGQLQPAEFLKRLRAAFEILEEAVSEGKIRLYGTATWNSYRVDAGSRDYISLSAIYDLARQVAGDQHHFKVIQLPYNLAMIEALVSENQEFSGVDGKQSVLQVALQYDLVVMTSASILQGRLTQGLPPVVADCLKGLRTDVQRSIQFVRSSPGVTTALVGMKQVEHVRENLESAQTPPAPWEEFMNLFRGSGTQTRPP